MEGSGVEVFANGPFPESTVDAAERLLGVRFPPSYRGFLAKFGFVSFGGEEVYGITSLDLSRPSVPNAVWVTLFERRRQPGLEKLVFVATVGGGSHYTIDMSRIDREGESPVVVWHPAVGADTRQLEVVAPSFGAFFRDRVVAELEFRARHEG